MFYFVLTIHLILSLLIIGLVLLQQGKGAQVGAILSGSSNTLFGAAGASTTLAKLTTWFAIAFFVTSVTLIKLGSNDRSSGAARITTSQPASGLEGSILGEMVKKSNTATDDAAGSNSAPIAPLSAPAGSGAPDAAGAPIAPSEAGANNP